MFNCKQGIQCKEIFEVISGQLKNYIIILCSWQIIMDNILKIKKKDLSTLHLSQYNLNVLIITKNTVSILSWKAFPELIENVIYLLMDTSDFVHVRKKFLPTLSSISLYLEVYFNLIHCCQGKYIIFSKRSFYFKC